MPVDKRLNFQTYEEAGEWFDRQDLSEHEKLLQPVSVQFDLQKSRNWVELEKDIARNIREIARKHKIPTRRLVNELLREGLASAR
jgi:hypothetical protein